MKYLSLLFSVCFIWSCGSDQKELDMLKAENAKLKSDLDSIRQRIESVEIAVALMPRTNQLIIGETYDADLFLVANEKGQMPMAFCYNSNDIKDTIYAKTNGRFSSLSITPKDTGSFVYSGIFIQDFLGHKDEQWFECTFDVKEKKANSKR